MSHRTVTDARRKVSLSHCRFLAIGVVSPKNLQKSAEGREIGPSGPISHEKSRLARRAKSNARHTDTHRYEKSRLRCSVPSHDMQTHFTTQQQTSQHHHKTSSQTQYYDVVITVRVHLVSERNNSPSIVPLEDDCTHFTGSTYAAIL